MIRLRAILSQRLARKPRASGDDPSTKSKAKAAGAVNPARAGMIPSAASAGTTPRWVNPARAGMIPGNPKVSSKHASKPRASGDDPDKCHALACIRA